MILYIYIKTMEEQTILDILINYLGLLSFATIFIYWIYKLGRGTNIEFFVKIICLMMFLFSVVMILGHMYYLSGLFEVY